MSEWWTYRLTSFLLFSPQTYRRLFELYNADVWPAQVATLALGVATFALLVRPTAARSRVALAILASLWALVGWAFHYRRYATINWAADYFAIAFAVEAAALAAAAFAMTAASDAPSSARRRAAFAIVLFALAGYPLLGVAFGRDLLHAEVFGLAPDPTAVGTLGLLMLLPDAKRGALAVVPLLWCATTGLTLWAMNDGEAAVAPLAALTTIAVLVTDRRRARDIERS